MKCFGHVTATPFTIFHPDGTHALDVPNFGFALVNQRQEQGKTVLSLPSGELISVQPNGDVQTRPANQVGAWELGVMDGGVITYTPDASTGVGFVFGLKEA